MRHKALPGLLIVVGQVLAAAGVLRFAILALLDDQLVAVADELALHVRAQIEVTPVSNALEFAVLALLAKWKRILDVGGADRVVGQLVLIVVAQDEPFGADSVIDVPLEPAIAPKLIPLARLTGMAEKLHLHLLELARAEGEVARCDLVAKALALLRDAERHLHAAAVHHVAEVHEHPLRRLRPEERLAVVAAHRADVRLEHQVKLARFGQRAQFLRVGREHLLRLADRGQVGDIAMPGQLFSVLGLELKMLQRAPGDLLFRIPVGNAGDEHLLAVELHPRALDVVIPVTALALAAVDHHVVKQVVMPGRLPDARVHDDRRLDADHLERPRRALRLHALVMRSDHVAPPRLLDVALQLDAKRAVIPQPVESAVNLRGLENKPTPPAERHDFFHPIVYMGPGHKKGAASSQRQSRCQGIASLSRFISVEKAAIVRTIPACCSAPAEYWRWCLPCCLSAR